ncbi:MAG: SLC13 family permease [Coriobacteriia bacterium]|nr:SLC13 family permease [Coriobacteriia bacterium]
MEGIAAKKLVGGALGLVAGLAVALGVPVLVGDAGLSQQGFACLGILAGAIVWWIADVLPEYVTGIVMVILFCIVAGVPTSVSFSAFTTSTWWLLVAAFALGAGMKVSGLMKRMALAILRVFPGSFAARVGGLMAVGTLVGPLIPSLAAKTSMITPLAMGMGDAAGYPRKGKQMQGLFLAMLVGVRNIAPAVISASVIGYALWGLYPEDIQAQFDMVHWFVAALPWFAVVTVLNYVALVCIYRPRGHQGQPSTLASETQAAPVPMSRHEKQMLVIMVATVALWVTQPLHGIASHVVALGAMAVMLACGVMGKPEFRKEIAWDSLVFIGTVIGLSSVFAEVGIQDWIIAACGPMFQSMAGNPYVFVLGIGIATVLLRFVIVSEMAYINIVMVFMIPLALSCNINPWVVGMAVYALVNPWFVLYQNPVYLAAYYSVDGQMATHGSLARYCVLYVVICLLGLAVSVPYWQGMGFFG